MSVSLTPLDSLIVYVVGLTLLQAVWRFLSTILVHGLTIHFSQPWPCRSLILVLSYLQSICRESLLIVGSAQSPEPSQYSVVNLTHIIAIEKSPSYRSWKRCTASVVARSRTALADEVTRLTHVTFIGVLHQFILTNVINGIAYTQSRQCHESSSRVLSPLTLEHGEPMTHTARLDAKHYRVRPEPLSALLHFHLFVREPIAVSNTTSLDVFHDCKMYGSPSISVGPSLSVRHKKRVGLSGIRTSAAVP